MPVRAVIFDMDGVLTDSEPLINEAAVTMFRELGLVVQPEDFLPFVGTGEDRYIGGVAEKYAFPLDGPAAKKRTYEIYLDLVPQKLSAFPGAGGCGTHRRLLAGHIHHEGVTGLVEVRETHVTSMTSTRSPAATSSASPRPAVRITS